MQRYSKDGPFEEPAVRCCECQRIILREEIQKFGCCPGCGTRRVRNILTMSLEEMETMRERQIDENFLKLFEGVPDA